MILTQAMPGSPAVAAVGWPNGSRRPDSDSEYRSCHGGLGPPTVVVDACDSQLHQDYTIDSEKICLLSESQLVAFKFGLLRLKSYLFCILRKSKNNSREISTGATSKTSEFYCRLCASVR
jgi:hypothetical protein